MKKPSPVEKYLALSPAERKKATAVFDREFIADTARPLTPTERKQWERAKRGRGRPKVGKGSKVISLSIEESLLKQSDSLAKKLKLSRASLVAIGLKALIAADGRV